MEISAIPPENGLIKEKKKKSLQLKSFDVRYKDSFRSTDETLSAPTTSTSWYILYSEIQGVICK
jgi:hypothetical protein